LGPIAIDSFDKECFYRVTADISNGIDEVRENNNIKDSPITQCVAPPSEPEPSTKFTIGDRVQVNTGDGSSLNVRSTPNGSVIGQQPDGGLGTVIDGSVFAGGFWWWEIDYDDNSDGWSAEDFLELAPSPEPEPELVLQPGPGEGKDIWTTSVFCYCPGGGGPGGGRDDHELVVGGFGDLYYTLIEFDLNGMPAHASSARLELYAFTQRGSGTVGMYLDRITEFWDWKTMGTGSDNERLWWADRPTAVQWIPNSLPAPTIGQWYSIDITDLYNAWQDGTHPNYGLQLRPVSTNDRWSEFYSSDYVDDPSLRPRLVVVE
jgi:hypothetical protein